MSLKHLRAMRDYRPPRKKDQMATAFLWTLAERAHSGARLKNGHQTIEGDTGFLSDEKFMEQLGVERQESLRELRRRFREAGAITSDRKHTGKSKWPVYRYNLNLDWLLQQCSSNAAALPANERSTCTASSDERSTDQTFNARRGASNERSTLTYSGLPKAGKTGDSQKQGVGGEQGGAETTSVSSPLPSKSKGEGQEALNPEILKIMERDAENMGWTLGVSCPFLFSELKPEPDGSTAYTLVKGVESWLPVFIGECLAHGMKDYDLNPCLQFLATSDVRSKVASLADMDSAWRRRLRHSFKAYVARSEERQGDTDQVLSYIERHWEQAEELLQAKLDVQRPPSHSLEAPLEDEPENGNMVRPSYLPEDAEDYLEGEVEIPDEPEMCHHCHKRPVLASYSTTCKECHENRITICVEDEDE